MPTATPVKVVDASALAALLFGEPGGARLAGRLAGAWLAAPALLPFEVANVCLIKMRRHPASRDRLRAAFALLPRLAIDIVAVDHDAVLSLADETRLTVYDASYLWLARELDGELVTLDKRLQAAAHAEF